MRAMRVARAVRFFFIQQRRSLFSGVVVTDAIVLASALYF